MKKQWLLLLSLALVLALLPGVMLGEAPENLKAVLTFDKPTVAVGEAIIGNWNITGGSPPYQSTCTWSIREGEIWHVIQGEHELKVPTSSFKPGFGEQGRLEIWVRDAAGKEFYDRQYHDITGGVATDPLELKLEADKNQVTAGQGEQIEATWSATGGTSPYTYHYVVYYFNSDGSQSYIPYEIVTGDTSLRFEPLVGVKGRLSVEAWDNLGRKTSQDWEFTIKGGKDLEPLQAVLTLDKESVAVDKEETITANWTITGGVPPYEVYGTWYVDDGWVYGNQTEDKDTLKPAYGERGRYALFVSDSLDNQTEANKEFTITGSVPADPLTLEVQLDKTEVQVNTPLTASCTASGGTPPYSYHFYWSVQDHHDEYPTNFTGRNYISDTVQSITPGYGVSGIVDIEVVDSLGRRAREQRDFTIKGAQEYEPIEANLTLNKDETAVGEAIKATWSPTGGLSPYTYTVLWRLKETEDAWGTAVRVLQQVTQLSDEMTPGFGVSGTIELQVTDSRGVMQRTTREFSVTGGSLDSVSLNLKVDKTTVDASALEDVTASWTIDGGAAPYHIKVNWDLFESENAFYGVSVRNREGTEFLSDSLQVSYGKKGRVAVSVQDSKGRFEYEEQDFEITGIETSKEPLKATIQLDKDKPKAYEPLTATVDIEGGEAPHTISFEWITISPEEIYHPFGSQAEGSKSSTRQLPNVFARGLVRATVKDAKNKVFIAWKFFNIQLEAGQRGDADGNGQVETKDVQALVDFLVESIKLPSPENANANKDEDVNIDDLLYIINLMVGD